MYSKTIYYFENKSRNTESEQFDLIRSELLKDCSANIPANKNTSHKTPFCMYVLYVCIYTL